MKPDYLGLCVWGKQWREANMGEISWVHVIAPTPAYLDQLKVFQGAFRAADDNEL